MGHPPPLRLDLVSRKRQLIRKFRSAHPCGTRANFELGFRSAQSSEDGRRIAAKFRANRAIREVYRMPPIGYPAFTRLIGNQPLLIVAFCRFVRCSSIVDPTS